MEEAWGALLRVANVTSGANTTLDHGALPVWLIATGTLAGVFAAISMLLSGVLLANHLRNFTVPTQQRYIVRIILIVPLYALYSLLCVLFVRASVYLSILRDSYEAFAFLQFFKLCAFFVGGEEELAAQLAGEPLFQMPFPLQKWSVRLGPTFVRVIKLCVLQYVIIRPLTSITAIICEIVGVYEEGSWSLRHAYVYLQVIIGNLSFTLAFYCLFAFYLATKTILAASKPLLKFICIKLVVFFVFWQGLVFAILSGFEVIPPLWKYSGWEVSLIIANALICIEMTAIAVLHAFAYPADVYRVAAQSQLPLVGGRSKQSVLGGLRASVSQKDTLRDTLSALGGDVQMEDTTTSDDNDDFDALPEDIAKARQARR